MKTEGLINWDFIAELEGCHVLHGYVPKPDGGSIESGVTIASGFDIGQFSARQVLNMFSGRPELGKKLVKYAGLTGHAAVERLHGCGLDITEDEARAVDEAVSAESLSKLVERYNNTPHATIKFEHLPEPVRTVAASVHFQYGNLATRCPSFWRYLAHNDYAGMVHELRNFGDKYPTRRNREADYLQTIFS